jgi:hypothetical protein
MKMNGNDSSKPTRYRGCSNRRRPMPIPFATRVPDIVRLAGQPARRWRAAALPLTFITALLPVAPATTKKSPPRPINLNSANFTEWQQVPGIGPAADKILQMRKSYRLSRAFDDLLAIRGIAKKRLDEITKYLLAGQPPTAPPIRLCRPKDKPWSWDAATSSEIATKSTASAGQPAKTVTRMKSRSNLGNPLFCESHARRPHANCVC